MRKSWKWALCLGLVSLLLLGGCGKEKKEPVDLVLVTDGSHTWAPWKRLWGEFLDRHPFHTPGANS